MPVFDAAFEPYPIIDKATGHEHMVLAHDLHVWVRGKADPFVCVTDSEAIELASRLAPTKRRIDVVAHPTVTVDLAEIADAARRGRVEDGADLLSRWTSGVPNWLDRIAVDRLNVDSCSDDVLGQVFGDYAYGLARLGLDADSVIAYGFDVADEDTPEQLTQTWRDVILERRLAAKAA